MGTGYRVRTLHEPILVCITGNPTHRPFPSLFDGVAREHSRKPDEFYGVVRRCTPGALVRADLFSRETREGFIGWGDEHRKFDGAAA
ncbi:MT-A70 family methyltransferase [Rhodoplanes serenus]|uniref:MT-A70 family methyltransferase n=1 Tax=Rhodoplanes serenus TaxID=200615 RepID=UPI00247A93BD|nr:MT-A70 family methyltransferase [Rhodoplanes serenus]